MMSAKEAKRLKKLITKRVYTECAYSWAGAQPPSELPRLRREYEEAKKKLSAFIEERTLK